jgi:hypothetical protein
LSWRLNMLTQARDSICTFACDWAYALNNTVPLTCGAGGAWSDGTPTCTLIPNYCPAVVAPGNGSVACTSTQLDGVCSWGCDLGYASNSPVNNRTWRCLLSGPTAGKWNVTTAPLCPAIASYCPSRAAPQFGTISCSGPMGRSMGDVCVSGCNAGYYVTGGAGLTSTASQTCNTSTTTVGVWSPANPTCTPNGQYCPVIVVANGTVTSTYRLAATASFTCRAGFNPFGPTQLLCLQDTLLQGYWNATAPVCAANPTYCNSFPSGVSNSVRVSCTGQGLGDACTFACSPGLRFCVCVGLTGRFRVLADGQLDQDLRQL